MGTHLKKIEDIRRKRIIYEDESEENQMTFYQEEKKIQELNRIAGYLSEEERKIMLSGEGFVRVPAQDMQYQRIDSYPRINL